MDAIQERVFAMINFYEYHNERLSKHDHYSSIIGHVSNHGVSETHLDYTPIMHMITSSPMYGYFYARDVVKKRTLEVEQSILADHEISYYYAKNIIRGRWPEAEQIILTNRVSAYLYTRDVVRRRWVEAEPLLKGDKRIWASYQSWVKEWLK